MGLPAHITRVLRRRAPFFARTMILRSFFDGSMGGKLDRAVFHDDITLSDNAQSDATYL